MQYRHGDLEDWSQKDTDINSGANDKYDSPILFIHEDQNEATYGRDGSWDLGVYWIDSIAGCVLFLLLL